MAGGTIEDLIWHFVGYMQVAGETSASRQYYEEMAHRRPPADDPDHHGPTHGAPHLPIDATSSPAAAPHLPSVNPEPPIMAAGTHGVPPLHIESGSLTLPGTAGALPIALAQPSWSFSWADGHAVPSHPVYHIAYEAAGSPLLVHTHQANTLTDVDHLLQSQQHASGDALTDDTRAELDGMMQEARSVVPDGLRDLASASPADQMAAIAQHDALLASGSATPHELAPGHYVDGVLLADGSTAIGPIPALADTPTPPALAHDGSASAQIMQTGDNLAENVAGVTDTSSATRILMVTGNYFETNAIIQVNVLHDSDTVTTAGVGSVHVSTGGDVASNSAGFTSQAYEVASYLGHPYGLYVHVDVVEGNLLTITSTVQSNLIHDGDVAVQQNTHYYSAISTGDNVQSNYSALSHLGQNYDLVVVNGDVHKANIIQQTNIVLDSDTVQVASSHGAGGASQTIDTGHNVLENQASIDHYGLSGFDALTGTSADLAGALARGETLDLSAFSSLPSASPTSLSILVVKGDYWDINSIQQTNVIADKDHAVQVVAQTGDHAAGDMTQWASTGSNHSINVAQIVDQGTGVQQMLGGTHYSDSVLIQADLVTKADTVVHGDPSTLVPELVAFTDHPLADAMPHDLALPGVLSMPHADGLGAVLT